MIVTLMIDETLSVSREEGDSVGDQRAGNEDV